MEAAVSGEYSNKTAIPSFMDRAAVCAISTATSRHRSSAIGAAARRRSSSSDWISGCFASGTSQFTSFSSTPGRGSSKRVHSTLKTECATAIPGKDAGLSRNAGLKTTFMMQKTDSHTVVPITLNSRCTIAARFAFLFAPTEEIMAVTQVPIFCPIIIGTAAP